jgi:prepilin-type N-terminal cleavage/methylation domain-containing protein
MRFFYFVYSYILEIHMNIHNQKGFTLIELLVVVAIIGILSTIVIVAVGTARNKGVDARIKSELVSVRGEAEIIALENDDIFSSVCDGIAGDVSDYCDDQVNSWVAYKMLNNPSDGMVGFCTDSTGFAGEVAVAPAGVDTSCL